MDIKALDLPGVLVLTPRRFADKRGYFFESYSEKAARAAGIHGEICPGQPVLFGRARHHPGLALPEATARAAKLVRVLQGSVFDVAVDVRTGSPTTGAGRGELTAEGARADFHPARLCPCVLHAGARHGGRLQGRRLLCARDRRRPDLGRSGPRDRLAGRRHGRGPVRQGTSSSSSLSTFVSPFAYEGS